MGHVAQYFYRTSRCLEMCPSTVLSVLYIFSNEINTKEKTEKKIIKSMPNKIKYEMSWFPLFELDGWLIDEFEKYRLMDHIA